MAAGIEAAGLILGAIPLLLAGLEFYAQGISVTKRYWKYNEEVKTVLYELKAENIMYINSINILLVGVVNQKEMVDFLNDPQGPRWKEERFDKKLRGRLGTSYDTYMASIVQMMATTEKFKERLKLDESGKPQFFYKSAFKEHYKRLKFSLKRSDYSELLGRLRRANQTLDRLTNQTRYLEAHRLTRRAAPNFRVVKERADKFYSALRAGWICPCQAHHTVSLRLEARMEDVSSDDDDDDDWHSRTMQDPFHVLFHYDTNDPAQASQMIGSWSWEEADVRVEHERGSPANEAKRNAIPTKSVRFAKNDMKDAVQAALEVHPNMRPIQDLCVAISELREPQRDVCFSLLANEIAKQKYGVRIYPTKQKPSDTDAWSVSSLRTVLDDSSFARRDRLRLAVTLASSVLQLHETPWLDESWGKDSIFFVKRPGMTVYDQPFVSRDFHQTALAAKSEMPTAVRRIIRNQPLYALGVALIELWYGKTLTELHKDEDGAQTTGIPQIDLITEWNTADRLVDELYDEAGGKYGDAVRRCIRCDFDRRASSLDDVNFQKDVYQGVVAQLKENYEFMFQH